MLAWISRGAVNLTEDTWMGPGFTQSAARTTNRNVAVATFSDKNTLNGPQATSTVGAASGDDQIHWVTTGSADRSKTLPRSMAQMLWSLGKESQVQPATLMQWVVLVSSQAPTSNTSTAKEPKWVQCFSLPIHILLAT